MHLATAQAWGSKPVLHLPVVNRFHPPVRAVRSTPLEGLTTTDRRTVMIQFDKGPLPPFARIFAACPDYGALKRHFWYDWGPIFLRGRATVSARVFRIAYDPDAPARLPARTMVGDAGPRTQGFPTKRGPTR